MKSPNIINSFEVEVDRFSPYEGVVALNGLSRVTELVDAFDAELTNEELRHDKEVDANGEVVFRIHARDVQYFSPEYAWPAIAAELGIVALHQDIDPTIIIRDPGHKIPQRITDIPVIH